MGCEIEAPDERSLAQFFFELGYVACWADAFIKNGETPPFELTDAVIERAWAILPETYEDGAEFDRKKALSDAADGLFASLTLALAVIDKAGIVWMGESKARAALARARGEAA